MRAVSAGSVDPPVSEAVCLPIIPLPAMARDKLADVLAAPHEAGSQ